MTHTFDERTEQRIQNEIPYDRRNLFRALRAATKSGSGRSGTETMVTATTVYQRGRREGYWNGYAAQDDIIKITEGLNKLVETGFAQKEVVRVGEANCTITGYKPSF